MPRRNENPQARDRVSRRDIVAWLRGEIIDGRLAPGVRLPTHAELQARFGSSRMTVDHAMSQLQKEGFVRARRKIGTFVADYPPHRWRFGLVFRGRPKDPAVVFDWSRYYEALQQAAEEITRRGSVRIDPFYDIDGHADSEATQQLLHQVTTRQLAGLIFVGPRQDLLGSALFDEGPLPRVLTSPLDGCGIPMVAGCQLTLARTLKLVKSQGKRRVALITLIGKPLEFHPDRVLAMAHRHGMETRRRWIQAANAYEPEWMRHVIASILDGDPEHRPDALIITDDHLVSPAVEALWEFGIRTPAQMAVVGHWNFPLRYESPLPVKLLGLDARQFMRRCLEVLQAQQRGETVPPVSHIPLITGEEAMSATSTRRLKLASPTSD